MWITIGPKSCFVPKLKPKPKHKFSQKTRTYIHTYAHTHSRIHTHTHTNSNIPGLLKFLPILHLEKLSAFRLKKNTFLGHGS